MRLLTFYLPVQIKLPQRQARCSFTWPMVLPQVQMSVVRWLVLLTQLLKSTHENDNKSSANILARSALSKGVTRNVWWNLGHVSEMCEPTSQAVRSNKQEVFRWESIYTQPHTRQHLQLQLLLSFPMRIPQCTQSIAYPYDLCAILRQSQQQQSSM